jgi:MFS family permease
MRRPLLFLNLAHAYDHFFLLILPTAVLALAPAWGLSYGEALALGTAAFVMFGLGTLPAGWLGDRWSRTHLMSIFFVGIGLASIVTGLAPGPITLTLGLGLLGLFASIYHPVGTALVVQNARRTGQSLGVNGVFGNLGVAAAGLVTGLITELVGWRAAFILPGVVAVLTGILFWRYVGPALDAQARPRPAARAGNAAPSAQIRVFVVVGVAALFGGIIFHGTTVALPKVFEERLAGLVDDIATIGLLVALVFALAAIAQIAVGHLLDRDGARLILPLIVVPQVACLLLAIDVSGWSMLALAVALMLLVFGEIPITAWLVGQYTASHWQSRVFALQYVLSLGVSAVVVPLIAVLHERTGGFATFFLLLAGAGALVALASLLLPARARVPDGSADRAAAGLRDSKPYRVGTVPNR